VQQFRAVDEIFARFDDWFPIALAPASDFEEPVAQSNAPPDRDVAMCGLAHEAWGSTS
jgi:hypothetical protein